ncbi:MAG: ComEC/Rec2 family competence protein, partial [Nocardioidaceae bacterium]
GGAVGLASPGLSHLVGVGSGLFARWIVAVGRHGAAFPGAAYDWGSDAFAVAVLAAVCAGIAFGAGHLLRRPLPCIGISLATAIVVVHPITPGWPPADWVMVACNVGQGDATVLNAGDGRAVVVDTGPDPRPVDRCLRELGIGRIPVVVLTHGHADHVGGLPGVLRGRRVGEIDVGPTGGPAPPDVPTRTVEYGETRRVGPLSWTVIGPADSLGTTEPVDPDSEGSAVNNASVVMLVEVRGARLLLTGDIEPEAQEELLRAWPDLHADVLKVPHHGSARQDPELFETLGARFGTLSAGVGNPFGHPTARTIELMRRTGIKPLRTDRQGDLALTVHDGALRAVTR